MKHCVADTLTAQQPALVSQKQAFATATYFIYTKEMHKKNNVSVRGWSNVVRMRREEAIPSAGLKAGPGLFYRYSFHNF